MDSLGSGAIKKHIDNCNGKISCVLNMYSCLNRLTARYSVHFRMTQFTPTAKHWPSKRCVRAHLFHPARSIVILAVIGSWEYNVQEVSAPPSTRKQEVITAPSPSRRNVPDIWRYLDLAHSNTQTYASTLTARLVYATAVQIIRKINTENQFPETIPIFSLI